MAPREPISRTYRAHRLRLHYADWGNEGAPLMLLVHGGRDHARSFDAVARAFADDYHVVAPDLRGHGDSEWAVGSSYAVVDHVYDVAELLRQIGRFPVTLVGHSLGGAIALQYAGTYPERVARVAAIEGLGPSPEMILRRREVPPGQRMREWIEQVRSFAGRLPRRYRSLEEAVARMREANPHLSEEQARHLTVHGVVRNEDDTYTWKFDNYVRIFSPYVFNVEEARALWGEITCPVLLVRGTESWASDPARDGRAAFFRNARVLNIEGAGHWVHHDRTEAFLAALRAFLSEPLAEAEEPCV